MFMLKMCSVLCFCTVCMLTNYYIGSLQCAKMCKIVRKCAECPEMCKNVRISVQSYDFQTMLFAWSETFTRHHARQTQSTLIISAHQTQSLSPLSSQMEASCSGIVQVYDKETYKR